MGCGSSQAKSGVADSVVPGASPNLPGAGTAAGDAAAAAAAGASASSSPPPPRMDRTQTVLHETDRGDVLKRMDQKVCVLVSDMSGFTKETRQHGIIHFASKILRMRQILHPVILRHAPLVVETEADNFLILFDTIKEGVQCALDMLACLGAYNRRWSGSDPEQKRMRLELGGIGIDWGEVTLEAPSGHMYGLAADGAFLLGEDVSEGDILLTHRVRDELHAHHQPMLDSQVKLVRKDDPSLLFSHLQKHYYIATGRKKKKENKYGTLDKVSSEAEKKLDKKLQRKRDDQTWSWAFGDTDDASYIGADCVALTKRHAFDLESKARAALDADIAARFMGDRDLFVCMFGLQTGLVTERADIATAFRLKHHVLELLESLIESHGGRCVEDTFIVFEHAFQSVACALAMAARVRSYNSSAPEAERIEPKAFGVHSGRMLIVPGTNVHWGDCVSTASKLGEDLGLPGEVLVSDRVWREIEALPAFTGPQLVVTPKDLETSGVAFKAFSLAGTLHPAHALPAVTLNYSAEQIAREALARGEGPEQLPSNFTSPSVAVVGAPQTPSFGPKRPRKQTADGLAADESAVEEAPLSRQIFAGPKRTVTLLDYQRAGRPANSDRGSLFCLPTGGAGGGGGGGGGGTVEVAAGVMSPNLAHALLVRHPTANASNGGNNSPALPSAVPKLGKSKSSRRSTAEAATVAALSASAAMSPAARASSLASTSPTNAAAAAASSVPASASSSSSSTAAAAGAGHASPLVSPDGQERRLSLRHRALIDEAQARMSDAEAQNMMRLKQRRSFDAGDETHVATVRAFDRLGSSHSRPSSKTGSRRTSLKGDGSITLLEAVAAANAAAAAASPTAAAEHKDASPSVGASQRRSISKSPMPPSSVESPPQPAASLSWPEAAAVAAAASSPVAAASPPLAIVVTSDDKPRRRSGSTKAEAAAAAAAADGKPRRRSGSSKTKSDEASHAAESHHHHHHQHQHESSGDAAARRSSASTKDKASKRASLAEAMMKAEAAEAACASSASSSTAPTVVTPVASPATVAATPSPAPAVLAPRSLAPLKPSGSPPPPPPSSSQQSQSQAKQLPPVTLGAKAPLVAAAAAASVAVAAPSAARAATKSADHSSSDSASSSSSSSSDSDSEGEE